MVAASVHSSSVLLEQDEYAAADEDEEAHSNRGGILNNFAANNDRLLRQAIDEAGVWTQDCLLVELWVWDHGSHCLHQKGLWVDPLMHRNCQDNGCPVCMLTKEGYEDHVPTTPVAPGEGLPGYMWSQLTHPADDLSHHPHNTFWSPRRPAADNIGFSSNHSRMSLSSIATSITSIPLNRGHNRHAIKWRDIQAIAQDPHQPWNPRMLTMAALDGVKYVTAIPFSCRDDHGERGMVLFLCRDGGDWSIATERNEQYMHAATQLIGTTYAIRRPWLTVVKEKRSEIQEALDRLKRQLGTQHTLSSLEPIVTENNDHDADDEDWKHVSLCKLVVDDIAARVTTAVTKARGAGTKPPPVTSWNESFLSFVGVFWTLLLLTTANDGIVKMFGAEYEIVLGYVTTHQQHCDAGWSILSHTCTYQTVRGVRYTLVLFVIGPGCAAT
jgi:hypothetical protein